MRRRQALSLARALLRGGQGKSNGGFVSEVKPVSLNKKIVPRNRDVIRQVDVCAGVP